MTQSMIHNIVSFIKYILESNVINFIIMLWLFAWVFDKFNLIDKIESAINKVKEVIDKSEFDKNESEIALQKAEKILSSADVEISRIEKDSLERCNLLKNKITETCSRDVERIKSNVQKVIDVEEHNVSNELIGYAVSSSLDSAQNTIIHLLEKDPMLHEKYIKQSLSDFEKVVS